jgi:hypothetical protein
MSASITEPISLRREFKYMSHTSASSHPTRVLLGVIIFAIALLMCFVKYNFVAICIVQTYPHNFSCGLHRYFNFPNSGGFICRLFKPNRFRLREYISMKEEVVITWSMRGECNWARPYMAIHVPPSTHPHYSYQSRTHTDSQDICICLLEHSIYT